MKRSAFILAMLVLAKPVVAQDIDALARQYVELPTVQSMMDTMFSAEALARNVINQLPPNFSISEDQAERIGAVMSETMAPLRPRMMDVMAQTSAAAFNAGELEALIAFYQSEHGAAIMMKMPQVMQSTLQQIAPDMQRVQAQLAPQIQAILSE